MLTEDVSSRIYASQCSASASVNLQTRLIGFPAEAESGCAADGANGAVVFGAAPPTRMGSHVKKKRICVTSHEDMPEYKDSSQTNSPIWARWLLGRRLADTPFAFTSTSLAYSGRS